MYVLYRKMFVKIRKVQVIHFQDNVIFETFVISVHLQRVIVIQFFMWHEALSCLCFETFVYCRYSFSSPKVSRKLGFCCNFVVQNQVLQKR